MVPDLRQKVEQLIFASGAPGCAVTLHDLLDDNELLILPDEPFYPASTFKLAVMVEAYHQAALGELCLDDPLLIRNEFISIADGSPFALSVSYDSETDLYARVGQSLPIRELVFRMIAWSSNLASCLLIDKCGSARITAYMDSLGAPGLVVRRGPEDYKAFALGLNNSVTARSMMQVLLKLLTGEAVSPVASAEMLEILRQQHFNEGIPARLPKEVVVAHKTGWNDYIYHDAAIIYPPGRKPYILVVLTRGLGEFDAAPALVSAISEAAYRALVSQP